MPSGKRITWTPALDAMITEGIKRKIARKDLAKLIGISVPVLRSRVRVLGLHCPGAPGAKKTHFFKPCKPLPAHDAIMDGVRFEDVRTGSAHQRRERLNR